MACIVICAIVQCFFLSRISCLPALEEQVIANINAGPVRCPCIEEIVTVLYCGKPCPIYRILCHGICQITGAARQYSIEPSGPNRFELPGSIDNICNTIREYRTVNTVHNHRCDSKHGVVIMHRFTVQYSCEYIQITSADIRGSAVYNTVIIPAASGIAAA